jgi:hypothetical protein
MPWRMMEFILARRNGSTTNHWKGMHLVAAVKRRQLPFDQARARTVAVFYQEANHVHRTDSRPQRHVPGREARRQGRHGPHPAP